MFWFVLLLVRRRQRAEASAPLFGSLVGRRCHANINRMCTSIDANGMAVKVMRGKIPRDFSSCGWKRNEASFRLAFCQVNNSD
jgi:hypothetical protein